MDEEKGERVTPVQQLISLNIVKIAGQVGCLTFMIIMAAMVIGLSLDSLLGTKPLFLILLMVVSAPVTFFMVLWTVKKNTSKFQ